MSDEQPPWVHVYEFEVESATRPDAWELLSAEERRRAADIPDRLVRQRFVARRSALRRILAGYPPESRRFFSTSDSGHVGVVAVAAGPVGVDVEIESARRPEQRIAARMFAPDERELLGGLDGDARRRLFHRCWVAKEAYAKGMGRGLGMPFEGFSVAAALHSPAGTGAVGRGWTVAVATDRDTHLAVAARGDGWRVVRREACGG